jgi:hypothetical protein
MVTLTEEVKEELTQREQSKQRVVSLLDGLDEDEIALLRLNIREKMDVDNNQRFDWEDVKIWAWIFLESFIYGIILACIFNGPEMWAAIQSGQFFTQTFISGVFVSIVKFTWKAAKQRMQSENKAKQEYIDALEQKLAEKDQTIANNDEIVKDLITYYSNQIFLRDLDLTGKKVAIQTKDQIARHFLQKYDHLVEIMQKINPLPIELQEEIEDETIEVESSPS